MNLLMHICCAPCVLYPAAVLQAEGSNFEGLFYNPNIHPLDEFKRRRENVELFSSDMDITVHYIDEFKQESWETFFGTEIQRCRMCYGLRLEKTASYAKDNGFDTFTTSLLVSPYQKHELIKELGEEAGRKYGVAFYYRDFRDGYRQGRQMAKEMGLYRQKFCGCIYSFINRS
jgi:epoxyqueuosine reductase